MLGGIFATSALVEKHGLKQSKADECIYYGKNIIQMRHMDDFVIVGKAEDVRSLLSDMKETLRVSGEEILEHEGQKVQFLGRTITKTAKGYSVGAAQSLISEIIEEEGLQGSRDTSKPGAKRETSERAAGDPCPRRRKS